MERTIGERIKNLRELKSEERVRENGTTIKFTQEDLARSMDVSRDQIKKWENNQVSLNAEKIIKLADFFNVSTDYLLRGGDPDTLVFMNKTGLSNETVNTLTNEAAHCPIPYMRKAIDALVAHPVALLMLYEYLYEFDLPTMEGTDSEGKWNSLDKNDMDRIKRLRVLDELEVCKVILRKNTEGRERK